MIKINLKKTGQTHRVHTMAFNSQITMAFSMPELLISEGSHKVLDKGSRILQQQWKWRESHSITKNYIQTTALNGY